MKEVKEECLKDPENKLWSKETEDIPEIKEIWRSIQDLEYQDEPDYNFIRGKLKQIYERSQYVPRWGSVQGYERYDYYGEKMRSGMNYPCYMPEKNYMPQVSAPAPTPAPMPEYMNPIGQPSVYNQPGMQQNYQLGLSAPPPIQHQHQHQIQTPTLPKMPLPEYEPRETNLNVSLNQIKILQFQKFKKQEPQNALNSSFSYQIVVPPTTEINQSISISNLPPLNDLAINNSVSTLVHKGLCYPGGSELILPISSVYPKNYQKFPGPAQEIRWESKMGPNQIPNKIMEAPQKYYGWGQRDFMPKEEPRQMNNYGNMMMSGQQQNYSHLPPPQPQPQLQQTAMMQSNMMHRSYVPNSSYCYPTQETKTE